MKYSLFIFLFIASSCYSQYTASVYYGKSLGVQLTKERKSGVYGIGITTFFNKGAVGKDYTGFYNLALAKEIVYNYNGIIYVTYGRLINNFVFSVKCGMAAKSIYYNGETNGEKWYVTRDGGTYLLYGFNVAYNIKKIQLLSSFDNINKFSLGIGINFKEYANTK
jgi:hypothetical protein